MSDRVAARLGCTASQLYTIVIGLALAVLMLVVGALPTLRQDDRPASATVPSAPASPP